MSGPAGAPGAGSPMRSAVDLEPGNSLHTIRESVSGELTYMRRVGGYAGYVGMRDGGGAMRSFTRCAGPIPYQERHVTTAHGDSR